MKVHVLWFASLAECVGVPAEIVEVPAGTSIEGLWGRLQEAHQGLKTLAYRPLAACDLEYSEWQRTLADGNEVAFLPPLSGG